MNEPERDTLREVWNDTDGRSRIEFWTDGEWIKIGRDVDDPSMCLTFRFDDDHYDQFRRGDHPFAVTIKDDRRSDARYIVDAHGAGGRYRFYKHDQMVLEVNDHELSAIRTANRKAAEFRRVEYEYADIARSYVNTLASGWGLEIAEMHISPEKPRGRVGVEHEYTTPNVNERFMAAVKGAEYTDWTGVRHETHDGECAGFRYHFFVDAEAVRDAEQDVNEGEHA